MKFLRLIAASLAAVLFIGYTVIHIEGDNNLVDDIVGHGGTLAVPESAVSRPAAR
ncbi:hypothetical protein R75461_08362 [Paraburkholderia nemoris]|uniref:hypothetical protein n=1 Tax=Paraburkholderia nemoris TaxID=2793076 RepID=UPI00190C9544|nr:MULTISPECIES: hypothetical protein [Paraburkholderia]MBK3787134.1 hypothetical protein [Paraburkholderia aspalathi]CAE6867359.1 hypothetical protein R75461_08362 [Paraburkholderia nemoris]